MPSLHQRCPLENTVLYAKTLGIAAPRVILAKALARPDLADIEQTIINLKEVGEREKKREGGGG